MICLFSVVTCLLWLFLWIPLMAIGLMLSVIVVQTVIIVIRDSFNEGEDGDER